jgi:hypothetical protein
MKEIVDQAGSYLTGMHTWAWMKNRTALLDVRANVTGETATWTEATKTLTLASAFTSYTFVTKDQIEILDGTGVTTGFYTVASKTSANAIVLASSISSGGIDLATGDIQFRLETPTITLPANYKGMIALNSALQSSLYFEPNFSTYRNLVLHRSLSAQGASAGYLATILFVDANTPVLEIWPSSNTAIAGAFELAYHSQWVRQSSDTAELDVPEFCRPLFYSILQAMARGYIMEDQGTLNQRLMDIRQGPLFMQAIEQDGQVQRWYGFIQNGATYIHGQRNTYGRGRGRTIYFLGGSLTSPS